MDTARIKRAAQQIEERQAALGWLLQYGGRLDGKDDAAKVEVRLSHASACPGAKEAEAVLSAYTRLQLSVAVKHATECCRNDITMAIDAIRHEIDSGGFD
jgi:CYTH domain-containing protein